MLQMKYVFAFLAAILIAAPALADNEHGRGGGHHHDGGGYKGAPGPIAGAGLPILAVGYGIYWLIKRRRQS